MDSSSSLRENSQGYCHGCCPNPFMAAHSDSHIPPVPLSRGSTALTRREFGVSATSSLFPNTTEFTNHESIPSLHESFYHFLKVFPQYTLTEKSDQIREQDYFQLSLSNFVCLDYIGHGLFSYSQLETQYQQTPYSPLLEISYKSVDLNSWMEEYYGRGGEESDDELDNFECKIRKRIMDFMNVSEEDYTMIFTANQSCAFKLVAESYPFHSNRNLLTVYDHENEAVEAMTETSSKRGARVSSAGFNWPHMTIQSRKLMHKLTNKRKKKRKRGLFVFPPQSKMTGSRYSYQWMTVAQDHGWHVLLDATALGPKEMDSLGLSLIKPDFLIFSFYKIFGYNPSGFGCLFIKKSTATVLSKDSKPGVGVVSLFPARKPEASSFHNSNIKSEIVEGMEMEMKGLDHADSLGLILISSRARYLINWLVNALTMLLHPYENGLPLVRIYGPAVAFERGSAVAFNVFDWNGKKIDPGIVQKLADRYNISLSCGCLRHVWSAEKHEEEKVETRTTTEEETSLNPRRDRVHSESGISVVTASLGFLTNFEDVYRLWAFVSRFLDADFLEKEKWRYMAI